MSITRLSILTILLSLMASCVGHHQNDQSESKAKAETKVLRHMVLFKFKDDAKAEEIQKINDSFKALPQAIPQIIDFEWGLNNSPENLHQGFTHCYLVTFGSEEDRAIYLPHIKHQEFVDSLEPHLEKAFVVDYWTNP